eukprot:m.109033 g.109033  ORF g.109033 m.109033 type:complete len:50 (+) comp12724_c7_seq3:845-994(+)
MSQTMREQVMKCMRLCGCCSFFAFLIAICVRVRVRIRFGRNYEGVADPL